MSVMVYNRFVSLLSIVVFVAAAVLLIPRIRRSLSDAGFGDIATWGAAAVALGATVGSLLYSEYFGFEPCRLCWYQRIAMYPLVLVLAMGAARRAPDVRWYGMPLAAIGALTSAYHVLVQNISGFGDGACSVGVPCAAKYVDQFGFVSIPVMALAGFTMILVLLVSFPPAPWSAEGRPSVLEESTS